MNGVLDGPAVLKGLIILNLMVMGGGFEPGCKIRHATQN